MSGKYAKKKNNPLLLAVLIIVLVAAAVAVAVLKMPGGEASGSDPVSTTVPGEEQTQPVTAEPTEAPSELPKPNGIDLGNGLIITKVAGYTGAYVEDGSDEQVSNVLMIEVFNYGVDPIQYAEISLAVGDKTAEFTMTTLPVGEKMIVLEKNRMAFDQSLEPGQAEARNVARFQVPMSLCSDKIQIQELNGALNISNISGQDIQGDIFIYYKNVSDDMLLGGITYRARIAEGMEKNGVRQILANHFTTGDSRIVFVTCG